MRNYEITVEDKQGVWRWHRYMSDSFHLVIIEALRFAATKDSLVLAIKNIPMEGV